MINDNSLYENSFTDWDVRKDEKISYFDPSLSYEATGYRPIDGQNGLDFNPEWFNKTGRTKKATKKYCPYRFGTKEYRDFWTEEGWRCREGYTVNGYTITGDNYYFINFYQLKSLDVKKSGEGRQFVVPDFYVEQYKYFHYVELCRYYGYNGCTLKCRGIGWSEINACMCANCYTWRMNTRSVVVSFADYYTQTTIKKIFDQLDWNNGNSEGGMRRLRQKKDTELYRRASRVEIVDGQEVETGQKSEIVGLVADKPRKVRGDRTDILLMEESGCHLKGTEVLMYDGTIKKVEDVKIGDNLMGDDGTPRRVLELHSGIDDMYKLIQQNGDTQIVNSRHIIYGKKKDYNTGEYNDFEIIAKDLYNHVKNNPRRIDGYKLIHSDKISFDEKPVPIDPYVFGFWLGDGDTKKARFSTGDIEVIKYLEKYGNEIGCYVNIQDCTNTSKCKHILFLRKENDKHNKFNKKLRELGVFGYKHIPDCYIYNSRNILLNVLAGLIDSDGNYNKGKHCIEIAQHNDRKIIIDQIEFICRILGMRISRDIKVSKERKIKGRIIKGGEINHRLIIYYGHSEIPCKIERKKTTERPINVKYAYKNPLCNSFKIEYYGKGEYYGFSVDSNHLFVLKDLTICHNSWPLFEKAYEQAKSLVSVQGKRVGNIFCFGTGGDEGPNLSGLASVFNSPTESDVLGYRHNHTKSGEYVITGFFVPAYNIVRDLMDNRGWTDPEKGKEYYQKERNKLLSKPNKYLIYCAENCWTPDEALALEGDGRFNNNLLIEQKSRIIMFKQTPEEYRPKYGELDVMFRDGNIDSDITGIKFEEKINGKICVIEPPLKTKDGKPYNNLYVAGIDGIDLGGNETSENTKHPSDFCIVIKKRVMGTNDPMYVAYYRDRPDDINVAFRNAMKLIMWYNAKAMIEKTRISFIKFMEKKKLKYRYMMRRPTSSSTNDTRRSNEFGAPSTEAIIQHGLDLVADFVEEYCHTIWIPEMIDELATYSYEQKRKFDMVAAMQMAELADEDLLGRIDVDTNPIFSEKQKQEYVYGYYIDENGYKRRGRIPLKRENQKYHFVNEEEPDTLYSPNGQDYQIQDGYEQSR